MPKLHNINEGITPSQKFMESDLARSGLMATDFPHGTARAIVPLDGGIARYQIPYGGGGNYARTRYDREKDKYMSPKGIPSRTYPPRDAMGYAQAAVNATVEGEKKQVLFELTTGIHAHGIGGCWGWCEDGDEGKQIRLDIMAGLHYGATHLVLIDGDWSSNPNVAKALATYALELAELGVVGHFPDFGRVGGYDDWFSATYGTDRSKWPDRKEVVAALYKLPQVPVNELEEANKWALSSQQKFNRSHVDLSDRGNATLWVRLLGRANVRFMTDMGKWAIWDSGRWTDAGEFPSEYANLVQRHYYLKAEALTRIAEGMPENNPRRGQLLARADAMGRWARGKCGTVGGRRAFLEDAASRRELQCTREDFDRDGNVLAFQNGVVDLRTGDLRDETQEDMILSHCAVAYPEHGAEPATKWAVRLRKLLVQWTSAAHGAPAPDRARWLKRRLGVALLGRNELDSLEIWQGAGANGKTVLARLVSNALGDYAAWIPAGTVLSSRSNRDAEAASPFLMTVVRKRVVFMTETADTAYLDEPKVKHLTGGDPIAMRGNYKDGATYQITFTPVLLTNPLPQVAQGDAALWDRLVIFPFLCRWKRVGALGSADTADADAELPEADLGVKNELSVDGGAQAWVLWWLVAGCLEYVAEGLGEAPPDAKARAVEYREKSDRLGHWLAESPFVLDAGGRVPVSVVYQSHLEWCRNEGGQAPSASVFSARLMDRFKGLIATGKSNGGRIYKGLRLKMTFKGLK